MNCKTLKSDLVYACKKFQSLGKELSVEADHLDIKDELFVSDSPILHPLEALVLIKSIKLLNYMVSFEWITTFNADDSMDLTPVSYYEMYNINLIDLASEGFQLQKSEVELFLNGLENIGPVIKNEFYDLGVFIRQKFNITCKHTLPYVRKQSV